MLIYSFFIEKDLKIEILNQIESAINFDEKGGRAHGMTHCMKPVDFIFETSDNYYFIEFKDPDHPRALPHDVAEFVQEVNDGSIKKKLIVKYRDSFLYRWAQDRLEKPIKYCVLLCCQHIEPAGYLQLQDEMRKELPIERAASWIRNIANNCVVLDLSSWNSVFPDWPVSRLSATATTLAAAPQPGAE